MEEVYAEGGRVSTKFAAVGRCHKCANKTRCQICQKVNMCNPTWGSPGLGGRRIKGREKIASGACGFGGGPQPPG